MAPRENRLRSARPAASSHAAYVDPCRSPAHSDPADRVSHTRRRSRTVRRLRSHRGHRRPSDHRRPRILRHPWRCVRLRPQRSHRVPARLWSVGRHREDPGRPRQDRVADRVDHQGSHRPRCAAARRPEACRPRYRRQPLPEARAGSCERIRAAHIAPSALAYRSARRNSRSPVRRQGAARHGRASSRTGSYATAHRVCSRRTPPTASRSPACCSKT